MPNLLIYDENFNFTKKQEYFQNCRFLKKKEKNPNTQS